MRILIFNAARPLATGGVSRYGKDLKELLSSSNIEVVSIIGKSAGNLLVRFIGVTWNFLHACNRCEVIHFITLSPYNILFMIVAKALGKKLVVTYHGDYREEISLSNHPIMFVLYVVTDGITRIFANKIVFPTKYLAAKMNLVTKGKTKVIPNPIQNTTTRDESLPEVMSNNLKDEIVLVTASNFNILRKCSPVALLLEAVKILAHDYSLKLLVFGEGTYLGKVSEGYGTVSDTVVFMGFREEFLQFLSSADAYVHVSGLDNQPYSVIDALRMGKVILCNDVGGILENLRPADNYIIELNLESLISGLQRLITDLLYDKNQFNKKGERNREYLFDRHGLDNIAQKYVALYSHLL